MWSKVIRSCDISLEVGADSSQPAIEFSRDRVIERPWDVWLRNFIRFGYQQTKQYPILHVSQLMELQHIGDALSVTISSLLAIESMSDLMQAIIEQEGVTYGLHFAQIQLRLSFFYQQVLQRDDDLPFTINCFQTHLKIATWIYLCDILRRIQLLTKLQNGILQLREGVLTKCSEGYCRMYPNL